MLTQSDQGTLPSAAGAGSKWKRSHHSRRLVPNKVQHQWPPSSTTCKGALPQQCRCKSPRRPGTRTHPQWVLGTELALVLVLELELVLAASALELARSLSR